MKKIKLITLMLTLATSICLSQTPTMNDVLTKKVKGDLTSIQLDNGAILNVGDTIIIGMATGNGQYNFVTQNFFCMSQPRNGYGVTCLDGYYSMGPTAGGSKIAIKDIKAKQKRVIILATHAQGFVYGTRILSITSALESGEIKINGFMTSNEALSELKKAKDKLDLGLITQQKFDKTKEELSKYIK